MFDAFSIKETLTTTMVLFAVIDIVGSYSHYRKLKAEIWAY